jgi:hypothetical protein
MSGNIQLRQKTKEASLSAVITRADGTIENLGVVSYYHRNPIRVLLWKLGRMFGLKARSA